VQEQRGLSRRLMNVCRIGDGVQQIQEDWPQGGHDWQQLLHGGHTLHGGQQQSQEFGLFASVLQVGTRRGCGGAAGVQLHTGGQAGIG
jgi:hypothetical protein